MEGMVKWWYCFDGIGRESIQRRRGEDRRATEEKIMPKIAGSREYVSSECGTFALRHPGVVGRPCQHGL
jgi:hypothetical protein